MQKNSSGADSYRENPLFVGGVTGIMTSKRCNIIKKGNSSISLFKIHISIEKKKSGLQTKTEGNMDYATFQKALI